MNVEKLIKRIEAVDPGRFDAKYDEILAVRDNADGPLMLFALAFKFGFLKGQRAAKAAARRERRRQDAMESAPPDDLAQILLDALAEQEGGGGHDG